MRSVSRAYGQFDKKWQLFCMHHLQRQSKNSAAFPELKGYAAHKDELSLQDGLLLWGSRVVISAKGQRQVLDILHESYPGISKMKALARSVVWWPGIDQNIERRVNGCRNCQESAAAKAPALLRPWELPARPWSRLHLDYAGPFLGKFFLIIVDAYSNKARFTICDGQLSFP